MDIEIKIYDLPLDLQRFNNRRRAEIQASERLIHTAFGKAAHLDHDPEGRPVVGGVDFSGDISISHCHDFCILAVTETPGASIGIDTETWREQLKRVAPRFLTAQEATVYDTPTLLLLAWTAKEAIYKAARIPGLALKEILLPAEAPTAAFTAAARNKNFMVKSHFLSRTRAVTSASTSIY